LSPTLIPRLYTARVAVHTCALILFVSLNSDSSNM